MTDGLTDSDLIKYATTIRDKIGENKRVMDQIANNSAEQALLGDFQGALDEAVMESGEAHQSQMMQYVNSKELQAGFQRVVFDMLLAKGPRVGIAELRSLAGSLWLLSTEQCPDSRYRHQRPTAGSETEGAGDTRNAQISRKGTARPNAPQSGAVQLLTKFQLSKSGRPFRLLWSANF